VKSYFLPCPFCGSLRSERLSVTDTGEAPVVQAIVICRECGLLYRNPYVPNLDESPAQDLYASPDQERIDAAEVAGRVPLHPHDYYLEIGCRAGYFAESFGALRSDVNAVLIEADMSLVAQAKQRNVHTVMLPGTLEEADLPPGAFALVVMRGVDHRFADHRANLALIVTLLREGGTLYAERRVFAENWTPDRATTTWFGRDQFVEYLSEFLDVYDVVDRADGARAVYGRKRPSGEQKLPATIRNRFSEHMEIVRAHSHS